MATAEEKELSDKINVLADSRFGAHNVESIKKLFLSYDRNSDGLLSQGELKEMLEDADIGNFITRGSWVDAIFEKLDKSPADGRLSWEEYLAAKSTPAGTAPPVPTTPGTPAKPVKTKPSSTLYCNWETNVCSNDPAQASTPAQVGNVSLSAWALPIGAAVGMVWLLTRK